MPTASPGTEPGRRPRHAGLHVAGAGARASRRTRARTSSRSARSSTRCSRASARSSGDTAADTMSAILTGRAAGPLGRRTRTSHPGSSGSSATASRRIRRSGSSRRTTSRFDLEALSGVSAPRSALDARARPVGSRRVPLLIGIAVALAGMAATYWAGKRAGFEPPPSFTQLTFRRGSIGSARFAPDGQTILYSAGWDGKPMEVFVSRLDSPESRPFGLSKAELLSVSPSGEMAVSVDRHDSFPFNRTGTLARIGMTGGGSPKEVLEDILWADWAPDGQSLAVVRQQGGKVRLEYPVGKVLYETAGWISHPRVSPRGDEVAFLDHAPSGRRLAAGWRSSTAPGNGERSRIPSRACRDSAGRPAARRSSSRRRPPVSTVLSRRRPAPAACASSRGARGHSRSRTSRRAAGS